MLQHAESMIGARAMKKPLQTKQQCFEETKPRKAIARRRQEEEASKKLAKLSSIHFKRINHHNSKILIKEMGLSFPLSQW